MHVFKRLLLFRPEKNKLNKLYFLIYEWYLAWNSFKFSPKFGKNQKVDGKKNVNRTVWVLFKMTFLRQKSVLFF